MACHLFSAMHYLNQCWLTTIGTLEINLSENLNQMQIFFSAKCIWKCGLQNGVHSLYIQVCWILGNVWVHVQHCSYWCPVALAQYPQSSVSTVLTKYLSYSNSFIQICDIYVRKCNHILKKKINLFRGYMSHVMFPNSSIILIFELFSEVNFMLTRPFKQPKTFEIWQLWNLYLKGKLDTWIKWLPFCRLHFHLILLEWKFFYFDLMFSSPGNDLALKRWQTITRWKHHYNDAIMSMMASQITSRRIVYSSIYWGADQRKHQSSASLAFVRGIHQWPVNSPHKGPVTWKMLPLDDVIMCCMKNIIELYLLILKV